MRLLYFAWLRERTGLAEEEISPPDAIATVADLLAWLGARGDGFRHAFENPAAIRAAIDHAHVRHDARIAGAREIALFPPMTGG